jgi:nucleolar protein 4
MEIDAALDRDGARTLAAVQAAAAGGGPAAKDRRNLYLGKEGHIEEGSAAWQGMSEYDR